MIAPMQDRQNLVNSMGFGSPHIGGFNACMCDGSVHTMSYSINPQVHQYLGNRADGLAVVPGTTPPMPIQPPPN